jgi:hypothetical protein
MEKVVFDAQVLASDVGTDRPAFAMHREERWSNVSSVVLKLPSTTGWNTLFTSPSGERKFVWAEMSNHDDFWLKLGTLNGTNCFKCRGFFGGFIDSTTVLSYKYENTTVGANKSIRFVVATATTTFA